jgi:hypothetical protein
MAIRGPPAGISPVLGEVLASGVATPPILEVIHSVADAETDRKIQNGGHDGYVDQQY